MNKTNRLIETKDLCKLYDRGRIRALDNINLTINQGEFIAIMGPSGCGKSTLLNMIGTLDTPTSGTVRILEENVANLKDIDVFRGQMMGFVFQFHNLIPKLTALENILIPTINIVSHRVERTARAKELLTEFGLQERENSLSKELSGGERQRVALARALINAPEILLADEPTGNLDSKVSKEIMKLFQTINKKKKVTIIMVTHQMPIAKYADRIIQMQDGKIVK